MSQQDRLPGKSLGGGLKITAPSEAQVGSEPRVLKSQAGDFQSPAKRAA